MSLDKETKIVRSSAPVETTVGSEVVLMMIDTGKCFGLGETASAVWRLLGTPTTVGPVVEALALEYDAPSDVLEADVLELLQQMTEQGLVETA